MADATATVLMPALRRRAASASHARSTCACCRWSRATRGRCSSRAAPTSRSASSRPSPQRSPPRAAAAMTVLEPLYSCEYVCVMRRDHPLAAEPSLTLDDYCAAAHVARQLRRTAAGFVDEALAALGRERRVVLTVNQFATAARVVHESDLLYGAAAQLRPGERLRRRARRCARVAARPAADRGRDALAPPPRTRPRAALAARQRRRGRPRARHRRAARGDDPAPGRRGGQPGLSAAPSRFAADENRSDGSAVRSTPWPGSKDSRAPCTPPATSSCSPAPAATAPVRRCCCCTAIPRRTSMWQRVAQRLAADFSLVIPDLRGYGDSTKPAPAATPELDHAQHSKRAMAADLAALMRSLGHERFAVVGHDRGGRVAHRLALDHPERVARLAVIDIVPTLDMYDATDMRFASWYYHWFFLIQPAPLPERMIGGDPSFYLRWTPRRLGLERDRLHRARGACRVRALLLPRRRDPCRVRGLPRLGVDRPRARPRLARRRREGRLRDARPLGRARRRRPPVRSARDSGGAVRGARSRARRWRRATSSPKSCPTRPRRSCSRSCAAEQSVTRSAPGRTRARTTIAPLRRRSAHVPVDQPARSLLSDPLLGLGAVHGRLRGRHARLGAHGHARLAGDRLPRPGPGRRARPAAEAPRDPAQLSGDRPPALPARVHPARDAAVLHRERQRGRAFLAPAALAGLPARQGRLRQAPVRHADERADDRLRVDQPLDAADDADDARLPRSRSAPAAPSPTARASSTSRR